MKEIISKISKGLFEYESPTIEMSVSSIALSLEMGTIYDGSFEVYSGNDLEIKGVIYSSSDNFVLENNQFIGKHNTIQYKVLTQNMEIGDELSGCLTFVCNGSEFEIPFHIRIIALVFHTDYGQIDTISTFVHYVQNHYDEAISLFYSDHFKNILLADQPNYLALYDGLIQSTNKHIALEEFLIGIHKKEKITILLEETEKSYSNLESSFGDSLTITKSNWGYSNLEIKCKGNFIKIEKTNITSEEFAGNHFILNYLVLFEQLHAGCNFASIVIKTNNQIVEYPVTVKQPPKYNEEQFESKKSIFEYIKNYLQFRMHKISIEQWIENSLIILEKACTQESILFMLLKAQVLTAQQKYEETEALLNALTQQMLSCKKEKTDLYCFYLYVNSLHKQDPKFTKEISNKIQEYYHKDSDSFLLFWTLLYMDEKLIENKSIRLLAIKKQFNKSCRSPILYFEAINILNEFPENVRGFDEFTIQVITFGAKNHFISTKLARQIADVAITEKVYTPLLFKILKFLYEIYKDKQILEAVCSLLIRSNKYGTEYYKWFALGVENDFKITKLYDYFMCSVDTDKWELLPQNILMYYLYNANSLLNKQAYLYYNIIKNKEKNMKMYHSYRNHILKYALAEIKKGNIDEFRAVIYEEVIDKSNYDVEVLTKLPEIISTYKLECNNQNITMVSICNEEQTIQKPVKLYHGKAYVVIHSKNFHIVFEDIYGNRYSKTVTHKLKRLFEEEKYTNLCLEQNPNNEILIATHITEVLKNSKNHRKTLALILEIIKKDCYRTAYLKTLMSKVIEYYSSNYDEQILDEYLSLFDYDKMNTETRAKAVELLIMRSKFDEVYNLFLKYGNMGISPRRVAGYCTRVIEEKGFEKDSTVLKLCLYSFQSKIYNESILQYLSTFYYGSTKEMFEIWEALKNFECENRELEERLLVQMIFTKAYESMKYAVYRSYYQKGTNEELRHAYYNFESYEYYVKENAIKDEVFHYIEVELQTGSYIDIICKLAYLKYYSQAEELNENQKILCKEMLHNLSNYNIRFNFFKAYNKYFTIPYQVKDKFIIEFKANPKNKVYINYILETGILDEKSYVTELMKSIYPGVFVKEFVLFYGENVQYYITEETVSGKNYTQSKNIHLCDEEIYMGDNRYGALNNMMISMDVNDDATLKDIALQYAVNRSITDAMFEIM